MSRPLLGTHEHHPSLASASISTSASGSARPLLEGLTTVSGADRSNSNSDSPRGASSPPVVITLPNEVPNTGEQENDTLPPQRQPPSEDVKLRIASPKQVVPPSPFTTAAQPLHSGGPNGSSSGVGRSTTLRSPKQIQVAASGTDSNGIEMAAVTKSKRRSMVSNSHTVNTDMNEKEGSGHSNHNGPYRFGYDNHGHRVPMMKALRNHVQRSWILNPKTPLRGYWNFVIFIIVMYYIIEIPLRLGFRIDNCNACATTVLHLLCDIFFCIDCLFLQIRTSHFIEDSNQTMLELNWRKVLMRYLRGWFALDFLTSVPIHHILVYYFDVTLAEYVYVSAFVQFSYLARMLKVIRFMDLLQYYHNVELSAGTVFNDLVKVLKFIFGFFIIAHMSACMWMFIALQERRDDTVPITEAIWDVRTWPGNLGYTAVPNIAEITASLANYSDPRVRQNIIFGAQEQMHLAEAVVPFTVDLSYLMALYWSVSTMTTVGYGDIIPRNDIEIAYACLVIFIGAVTFGYIISNVSTIIQIEDDADTKIRDKIQSINAYMGYRKLPPDLQKKIRNHYEYTWKRKTVYDEKSILINLPTYLRTRVALYLNQDLIRNVAFLRDLGSDCLALLVTELRPFRVGAGYWIFKQGSLGREMCFVHEGTVEVLGKKNKQLAVLQAGAYFGEYAILADRPTKRSASVRALTATDLFALTKESFDEVLQVYPELKEEVEAHAEARLREAMEGKAERDYTVLKTADGLDSAASGAAPATPGTPLRKPASPGVLASQSSSTHLTPSHRPSTTRLISVPAPFGSPNLTALGLRGVAGAAGNPMRMSGVGLGSVTAAVVGLAPSSPVLRGSTLGFNPYLSLPNSRPEETEDENHIRRTVLRGKEQLEAIMHPEMADEIRQESAEAEAMLDAQIAAEKQFMEANAGMFRTPLPVQKQEISNTNPYIALNARPSISGASGSPDAAAYVPSSRANVMHVARMSNGAFSLDSESERTANQHGAIGEEMQAFLNQLQQTVSQTVQPLHAAHQQLQEMHSETAMTQQTLDDLVNSIDFHAPEPWHHPQ